MHRLLLAVRLLVIALCCALAAGCANCNLPRIDPSGRRILICEPASGAGSCCPQFCSGPICGAPPCGAAPAGPTFANEPGRQRPHDAANVAISPARVIAPVGAEVVLLGAVCGPDGYMRAHERVEWMLAPGGVGEFVALGKRGVLDVLRGPDDAPRKLDNAYAIGTTSTRYVMLTRGTPTPSDDVPVQRGQAWVTVTSPVEGASYVTAYAPSVYAWDQRKQTSTIYWVDAQWTFPPAANNPIGTRHTFTTTVNRQTDRSPLVGWLVRYEISGGPAAGFGPDGGQVVEVPTNTLGQASAEIFQQQPAAGTNQINIQVIRPAELSGSYGQRMVVGSGSTQKTWSAATVLLRVTGPAQAAVGALATYRIEVSNPGSLSAGQVVVTNEIPPGMSFVSSNPPLQSDGRNVVWQVGDLAATQARALEINLRAERAGTVNNCATLQAADGIAARSCASTTVLDATVPAQSLALAMTGPATAVVGQEVEFVATVTNNGTTATPALVIVDRFDDGLQHASRTSPIERDLEPLQPGQSRRIIVALRATREGQLCNSMEIVADGAVKATAKACVNAAATPAAAPPPAARPNIVVKKSGPPRLTVGQVADFSIEITNNGQADATRLRIVDSYDRALEPRFATDGWAQDGDDLVWALASLPAGRTVRYQVQCACLSPAARACNRAKVTSAEGAGGEAEACLEVGAAPAGAPPAVPPAPGTPPAGTAPGGPIGAARLTLTIGDLTDPIGVGRETTYDIKITNSGTASDRQVALVVTVPDQMTPLPVGTLGPGAPRIDGRTVRFAPVAELRPGETLTYQIRVRADRPGLARLRADVSGASDPRGASDEETTTVFTQ